MSTTIEPVRMTYKMTYKIAMAAGQDAGDRSMKAAGRSKWNKNDLTAAAAEAQRLIALID